MCHKLVHVYLQEGFRCVHEFDSRTQTLPCAAPSRCKTRRPRYVAHRAGPCPPSQFQIFAHHRRRCHSRVCQVRFEELRAEGTLEQFGVMPREDRYRAPSDGGTRRRMAVLAWIAGDAEAWRVACGRGRGRARGRNASVQQGLSPAPPQPPPLLPVEEEQQADQVEQSGQNEQNEQARDAATSTRVVTEPGPNPEEGSGPSEGAGTQRNAECVPSDARRRSRRWFNRQSGEMRLGLVVRVAGRSPSPESDQTVRVRERRSISGSGRRPSDAVPAADGEEREQEGEDANARPVPATAAVAAETGAEPEAQTEVQNETESAQAAE